MDAAILDLGRAWKFLFLGLSDYCDDVSVKLKYLNPYDYTFSPVFFAISCEGGHFESREYMPVSHQNSQTYKKIGVDNSIFVGFSVLY